ncbi:hypothetical protein [Sphaerisporangium aureirubrum]|uniref:Fibronectin type-III domain-containing protein n=1 Tax=Sphaerisporangium aureirubrum TaxID=1544736 RepID=A0ABW1ND29_9ACTN
MSTPPPDPDPRLALRPEVTLRFAGDRLIVSWPPVGAAFGYRVVVAAAGGSEYRAEVAEPPLVCDFVPGRGITYSATVEVLGMPSEVATLTTPDAITLLRELRDRLAASRTAEGVHTFGEEVVAEAGVRALIGAYSLTATADPVLDEQAVTLTLAGTSTWPAVIEAPVELVFTVSPAYTLQASWTARPAPGYLLAHTYETFEEGPYDYLDLAGPVFVATTYAHREPGIFFEVRPGLSFQAGITVPGSTPVLVGGALEDGPAFSWTAAAALGALTITPIGRPALTLTGGLVTLTPDRLEIRGEVPVDGVAVPAVLDLPTAATPAPTLRLTEPPLTGTTSGALLAAAGLADAVGARLPADVLTLAGVRVRELSITYSPDGIEPTVTAVVLDFGTTDWSPVPGLTLSGFRLEASVRQAAGYEPVGAVVLAGTLAVGGGAYEVRAGAVGDGTWYLEIDQEGISAGDLTGLAGMSPAVATGVLPQALFEGFPLTLTHAAVLADPVAAEVLVVELTVAQTTPWLIAGGLVTVTGWAADISIERGKDGEWSPSAVLSGTVAVGGADFAISVSAPPGDGRLWMLELDEDAVVRLPSVTDLLGLFGTAAPRLPAGIGNLGDLEITGFKVAFDPGLTRVAYLFLRIEQASDWVIVPGAGTQMLALDDFTAALSMTPEGSAGFLAGTLVVGGTPVDAGLVKNDPAGDWLLRAGWSERVTVPGWRGLEDWLSAGPVTRALPVGLPLDDGFDVSRVWLRFTGETGALSAFGFTLHAAELWTVVRDQLALTRVRAELQLPWPVRAEGVVAVLGGVVTLAGVDIGITAVKPADGPWEFTGSLLEGLTIDLVGAANGISGGLALPGDAVTYGLPAEITIERAEVLAVPDTGRFHFEGTAGFDWHFTIGGADFAVRSVGGTVDVAARDEPLVAALTGVFDFATIRAAVSVTLGTGDTPTVLTGVVLPADLDALDVASVTAMGAADGGWAEVVPSDFPGLGFSDAAFALDLTGRRLLLYGAVSYGTGRTASGLVFCAPNPTGWSYVVALGLADGFRFGDLFTALAVVDDVLRVRDARLVVCDLPGGTLGAVAADTTGALAAVDPPAVSPLAGLDADPLALATGVYVTATLDFGSALFSRILQIGRDGTPPSVRVSALVDRADAANTVFAADLPDIVVLDTVAFTGVHLAYRPSRRDRLELTGELALTGVFGDDYRFAVTMVVDDAGLTAVAGQTSQEIANPFLLPGVVLSGLGVEIVYVWAHGTVAGTSSYALTGHVLLGPVPEAGETDERISCLARLALLDGSPALFSVELDRDLSIGRLLASLVTGRGAGWPSGYVDVVVHDGTRIMYATAAGALADPSFTAGLTVDAWVRLMLLVPLDLRAVLTFRRSGDRYVGMHAEISLVEPLDLVFITLSGPAFTGGPVLAIDTGENPSFELSTGVSFLGAPLLTTGVSVRKGADGGNRFDGHFTAELAPFGALDCRFVYITHPGRDSELTVLDWPSFTWARELFDVFRAIRSLGGGSSLCGQLARLVPTIGYHTTFQLRPDVTMEGDELVFLLTGTYSFRIDGAREPFLDVTLPPLRVEIATDTRWEQLPERLAEEFVLAGPRLAADLLKQPEKVAVLVGMLVGEKALEAALQLVCEDLVEGAVAAAAKAAADAAATAVGGAAALSAAAVLAVVTASLADSRSHDSGGSGGSGGGGGSDDDDSSSGDSDDDSGDSGGSGGGSGTAVPAVPVFKSLRYAAENVTAVWDAAARANGYTFELLDPDGVGLGSQDVKMALTGSLPVDPDRLATGVHHGRVRARRESALSGWATLPLVKTAPPAVGITLGDAGLVVGWTDAVDADRYQVRVDGVVTEVAGTLRELVLPAPESGVVTAEVHAVRAGEIPGGWSAPARFEIIPAPSGLAVRQRGDMFHLTWTPPVFSEPLSYQAQTYYGMGYGWVTVDENGNVIDSGSSFWEVVQSESTGPDTGEGATLAANSTAIRVRFTLPDRAGPWATLEGRLLELPSVLAANYTSEALQLSWYPIQDATYEVMLTPGDVLVPTGDTSMEFAADLLTRGALHDLRVRAVIGEDVGGWSDPPAQVPVIDPPAEVTASYADGQITVGWQEAEGAQRYRVTVLDSGGQVLRVQEEIGGPVALDAGDLPRGRGFGVRVAAMFDGFASADSPLATFDMLDPPAGLTADHDGIAVRLTWSPVPGAERYRVRLLNAQGGVVVSVVTGETSAEITGVGVSAQVRVVAQPWSAAVPVARYTCLSLSGQEPTVLRVSQRDLDGLYKPKQTNPRTGWVAAVRGPGGPLSVLALLAAAIRTPQVTEARMYAALRDGDMREPSGNHDYTTPADALEAILRLDRVLTAKGVLTSNAPYHVFNGTLTLPFAREGTGPLVCVAFGTATNLSGTALPGARGSVVFGVAEDRAALYTPSPQNRNWLAFTDTPDLPLTLLRRMAGLLTGQGVLTAAEADGVL